ncbi:MAG: rhomboid family intramembrane serine protease [Flavobacteriales bacterium]
MLEDLKNLFKGNNFIGQIILICASVFLVENIVSNISPGTGMQITRWFAMHSYLPSVLTSPWSLFTYMFLHGSFQHLFWNMIMFYWFARIVNDFMGKQRLVGLYFLGGISGALFYLIVYSLQVLGGETVIDTPLVGASAGIMAVVALAGFRFGDYQMNLLLIGPVRLRYVALGIFVMNTVLDFSMNTGGKLSHLGGAAFGYFYFRTLNQGKDYAFDFSNFLNKIPKLFQRKPKIRIVKNNTTSYQSRPTGHSSSQAEDQKRMDAILDKISKSGYDNLSKDEKAFLFKMSNKN